MRILQRIRSRAHGKTDMHAVAECIRLDHYNGIRYIDRQKVCAAVKSFISDFLNAFRKSNPAEAFAAGKCPERNAPDAGG